MTEGTCSDVLSQVALQFQEKLVQLLSFKSRRVVVLAGPTGVGKTEISLRLAEAIGGEIVSADSVQVYRGMDIGTAKATAADRQRVPHHLVDVCDITESYSVFDYCKEAVTCMNAILAKNRPVIVVGGTGFYLHALIYGPPSGPPSDPHIRELLIREAGQIGVEFLYDRLRSFDPAYASTITPNDLHKIVRGLEIIILSGRRVSDFSWKTRHPLSSYDFRCWFLHRPRPQLYERLQARCLEMLSSGFLEEVVALDKAGIRSNKTACQSIGYRQALEFLDTARTPHDHETFVEKFIQASRHLAKRQFTWFRKEPLFRWLDISTMSQEQVLEILAADYESLLPIAPPELEGGQYPFFSPQEKPDTP